MGSSVDRRLDGLREAPGDGSGERDLSKFLFSFTEQVHVDTKMNHENTGKTAHRCHDLNTRLEKLMWNYFRKHAEHVEQVTSLGYYCWVFCCCFNATTGFMTQSMV